MIKRLLYSLSFFILLCFNVKTFGQEQDPLEILKQREKESIEKSWDQLGKFLGSIYFEVTTPDTANYENGIIPWASLEKPDEAIPNLKDAKEIIITSSKVTVIIDYPLKAEYQFELISDSGFSRATLLKEISKAYYKIYEDEEATASIKTIPIEKRTTMHNRNETNGKHGIWGHDIADLALSEIMVYTTNDGKLILTLMIES